ncbi:MAG: NAD(P) transhydrogenase subunit alpha [Vicingus serpentipes]|nr:NAD(P) transhydrogenase subunit alpha [Vicingus serpentipes]
MKKIGLLRESQHSNIAVLIPQNIKQLKNDAEFFIETNAGLASGYTDEDYIDAGASIINSKQELINSSDLIMSYSSVIGNENINAAKTFIGAYDVLSDYCTVIPFQQKGIDVYSLNLLPRTTIAQSMDTLSSVASILGYKAVLIASTISPFTVPMITGAGGTLRPAKILILGAGVAGLQAIATAKRLGAIVKAFDVRKASKTDVESLGAEFIDIEGAIDSSIAGGYAVEQDKAYLEKVDQILFDETVNADIIIATAKIPGKKAPLLISEAAVKAMKPDSVIVDLAADTGGNCALTQPGKTIVTENRITIVGDTRMLDKIAKSASFLLANNFASFLKHYLANNDDDEILNATKVITDGKVTNPRLIAEIDNL